MRFNRLVPRCNRWQSSLLMMVLALAICGCGGRGSVYGKVTYKNKAVPWGQVLFEGSDGATRQGSIDKDGGYLVDDLAVGEVKVAVMSPNPKGITVMSKGNKQPEKFADVPNWFAIPPKYEAIAKSGLVYTIKKGENPIDIDLK